MRVEKEPRKRLIFLIDSESYLKQTPSGRPGQNQMSEKVDSIQSFLSKSMQTITDDDSIDLILLRFIKPPTQVDAEQTQDPQAHKSTKVKQEEPRTENLEPVIDQALSQTPAEPKT